MTLTGSFLFSFHKLKLIGQTQVSYHESSCLNSCHVNICHSNFYEIFFPYRPIALAWEVRKTSPGKLHLSNRNDPNSPSPAHLFSPGGMNKNRTMPAAGDGNNSWADMVKGRTLNKPGYHNYHSGLLQKQVILFLFLILQPKSCRESSETVLFRCSRSLHDLIANPDCKETIGITFETEISLVHANYQQ